MSKDYPSRTPVDIAALLDALTPEEQVSLLAGADFWTTEPVARLGIPKLKVSDGPNGARGAGGLTNGTKAAAFPCAIALGASWNVAAAREMGCELAAETRSKGARVLLAPTVNIHRSGLNGRNFECYSEDPMLTSALAVAYIEGLQAQGVGATIKHFVANDSEIERQTISSDVDERTLREIYLAPFEAAVKKAGVWAVMTGYNRLNGVHMDAHKWAMTEVAREQWGYDGIFMSDWFGTNSTAESINAGHDLEMPGPSRYRGARLLTAMEAGEVAPETVRAACARLLKLFERVGAFESEGPEEEVTRDLPETRALIRRLGAEGAVLLKNDGILPLAGAPSVAAIGPNAAVARIMGGGSAQINAPYRVSPLEGLRAALGADKVATAPGCGNNRLIEVLKGDLKLSFFRGRSFEGAPMHTLSEQEANFFWFDLPVEDFDQDNFSVRIETRFTPAESGTYVAGLVNAGFARAYVDGQEIIDGETGWQKGMNFFGLANDEQRGTVELEAGRSYELRIDYYSPDHPDDGITVRALRFGIEKPTGQAEIDAAVALAGARDVALLFVGRNEEWDSEGHDLPHMDLPGDQGALIEAVAAVNPNTVVVLQTGGPVEMPWLDKVKAVVQFWYPGQEVGHAMADVLLGKVGPGGRLPQSFPVAMKDNGAWTQAAISYPGEGGHVRYDEGVFVGYRFHDSRKVPVLFPFGHGLSYTRFGWSTAQVSSTKMTAAGVTLSLEVTNSGDRAGAEVVQLYVTPAEAPVARPEKELRGFAKLALAPGESGLAEITVTARELAFFDVAKGGWSAPAGRYGLVVASSAEAVQERLEITLAEDWFEPA
ncbi:glycoside hydrolase family 3 C-terminal domain-containing protein [Pseudooceanicola sp. CBS1P-1]|uniref:Beta-D-glucoside glucohydrolase n=1 Tax=Pseudooceanicola albus TaxID=2692189 RepID=A0A6L7G0S5_9RHOB|nr:MULTISPECIES: glycoside hydrolase family 3 C-terminal domain-containing protein [Pseudooceanicola]MBT9382436.1 glycoside hydrolase family 3 C-terminal domain-containing protein [Pseudooceanicola endophyticus]MXN16977.1 beta-glucosidase [Pseudooceanicola albus]